VIDHVFIDIAGASAQVERWTFNGELYDQISVTVQSTEDYLLFADEVTAKILSRKDSYVVTCWGLEKTKGWYLTRVSESGEDTAKLTPTRRHPFAGRIWTDVQQLVWPLVLNRSLCRRDLTSVSKYLGCDSDDFDKLDRIRYCYWSLMNRYGIITRAEETLKNAVGGLTSGVVGAVANLLRG
jgi:hypothetical protein